MEKGLENLYSNRQEEISSKNNIFNQAVRYLEKNAIDPDRFVGIYGRDMVMADKAEAKKLKAQMLKNGKAPEGLKLATVLESLVTEHISKSSWFGENTDAKPAAPFDDCKNGIDTLTIFRKEGGFEKYMGLVMDATFNPSYQLCGKFNKIRGEIVRGDLGKMKYFESGKIRGQMTHIPKVIVGVEEKTIEELGKLKSMGKEDDIANHPIQLQILEEIEMQLRVFAEYTEKQPNDTYYKKSEHDIRGELVQIYKDFHEIIKEVLKERRVKIKDTGKRDEMFQRIKEETEKILTRDRN